MADPVSSDHVAMFPWFAYGHFIPYLHLANKLAERGYRVSFLLPKGAKPKLTQLNQYPNLIHFFPLIVPHVDGLPSGAETSADIPFSLQNYLCTAMDQTKDQVKAILGAIKPKFVLYDFAYWVASFSQELGFKSISYSIVSAALQALRVVPSRKMIKGMTFEEMMQTPPGYPSSKVVPRPDEAAEAEVFCLQFGSGLSFYERLVKSKKESDAFAIRTCYEIEGPFIDYLAQQYAKPILLTGPVLPEKRVSQLDEKWDKWLSKFEEGSVVFCAFGSQNILENKQFQELLLGFESYGLPFLVALKPPEGCSSIEEGLPEGFEERVKRRGCVYKHPSVGCFVSHCGFSSMWESLQGDCQIVLIPAHGDHIVTTMIMVEEMEVAVEVKREENGWISKESLCNAMESVMSRDSEVAITVKNNHSKWKKILSDKEMQEKYIDTFIMNLQTLWQ